MNILSTKQRPGPCQAAATNCKSGQGQVGAGAGRSGMGGCLDNEVAYYRRSRVDWSSSANLPGIVCERQPLMCFLSLLFCLLLNVMSME